MKGVDIDLEKIPMDDAKTYELFSNGLGARILLLAALTSSHLSGSSSIDSWD